MKKAKSVDAMASQPVDSSTTDNSHSFPGETYAWYVVAVLMIVYVFSFMDRQILALLVDPIKQDLNISDTQISYLGGFAFALFYTFFGIPIARLADTKNRKVIITAGLVVWSAFTMACATAGRFWTFALYRMGVGVGEATLSPSAYSLITDLFRPERLAMAISIYSAGIYIGTGLANVFGGLVIGYTSSIENLSLPLMGPVEPWQYVFVAVGLPGLLFSVVMLTIKEPLRREKGRVQSSGKVQAVPLSEVVNYITANRKTFIYHNLGFAFCSFISYGGAYWIPSFLIRVHEVSAQNTGLYYGTIVMIFGTLGITFGGYLSDRLSKKGYADAKMRVGMLGALMHIPFGILFPLMPTLSFALLFIAIATFTAAMPFGVAAAAIQQMMPPRMRAQGSAIYLFVINLIGLGVGPSAVAWVTDYYYQDPGQVGMSLLWISAIFGMVATTLLYQGMRHFSRSLEHLDAYQGTN